MAGKRMKLVNGQWQAVVNPAEANKAVQSADTNEQAAPVVPANTETDALNKQASELKEAPAIDATTGTEELQNSVIQPATPPVSQEQVDYANALKQQDQINQESLSSFRDLLDTYKPESTAEREAREKRDRIRDGIAAASSMGAALGNLITAGSEDGRSVKVQPLNEGINKAKENERAIRDKRDAKGIELRNKYLAMRQKMADDKVTSTWQAYKLKREQDREDARQAAKDKQAAAKLMADNIKHNQRMAMDWKKNEDTNERARLSRALRLQLHDNSIKKSGDILRLSVNGGKNAINVDKAYLASNPYFAGQIEKFIPQAYFEYGENGPESKITRVNKDGSYNQAGIQSLMSKFLEHNDDDTKKIVESYVNELHKKEFKDKSEEEVNKLKQQYYMEEITKAIKSRDELISFMKDVWDATLDNE